ncbi:hypothetical protein ZHAS_00011155 [Anopheles sinensis]|uniref:CCC domain-containing protein n=1 Tax=Anopheles sinensis TaxID=74873 RepID=A0A084VZG6_ANOSI|nr:hypothetical protein ZHAS_00011155 [Anopheles sinensis]
MVLARLLAVLFGAAIWESSLTTAALATNDVHLPGESDFHQQQHEGAKSAYPTPSSIVTYHIEHEQTELAARRYLATLNDSEIHRLPAWCKPCNASVLHYCRTADFLNDHCCCEYSHTKGRSLRTLTWWGRMRGSPGAFAWRHIAFLQVVLHNLTHNSSQGKPITSLLDLIV